MQEKVHQCSLCGKVFESGPKLGGHLTTHRIDKAKVILEVFDGKKPTFDLRETLIDLGIKEDKCERCGWDEKFPGDKYSRCQLHHKDGVADNNALENLEILCPNHHSLTPTWGRRGNHKSSRTYRYGKDNLPA